MPYPRARPSPAWCLLYERAEPVAGLDCSFEKLLYSIVVRRVAVLVVGLVVISNSLGL
jgi:hypothetical protein